MDILYTIAEDYSGEELKYSLRSLANIPHDKVFIVGYCPNWLQNVVHIPTTQTGTKWHNVPQNLIVACKDNRLSSNFIYFNDDFFLLEPLRTPTKDLNLYNGTLKATLDRFFKRENAPTPYMRGMGQTVEFLKGLGIADPKNYELHVPFVFNKKKLAKMFELGAQDKIDCLHYRSLYGNLYLSGGVSMPDVKIYSRQGFLPDLGKFLSCDDGGFYVAQHYLSQKFPVKSKYEI